MPNIDHWTVHIYCTLLCVQMSCCLVLRIVPPPSWWRKHCHPTYTSTNTLEGSYKQKRKKPEKIEINVKIQRLSPFVCAQGRLPSTLLKLRLSPSPVTHSLRAIQRQWKYCTYRFAQSKRIFYDKYQQWEAPRNTTSILLLRVPYVYRLHFSPCLNAHIFVHIHNKF